MSAWVESGQMADGYEPPSTRLPSPAAPPVDWTAAPGAASAWLIAENDRQGWRGIILDLLDDPEFRAEARERLAQP